MTARELTKRPAAPWGLWVNDCAINSCQQGAGWWFLFRSRHEPSGRVVSYSALLGKFAIPGDLAWVKCEDPYGEEIDDATTREAAEWLRNKMISEGVPKSAVKIKRTPKELR